MWSAAIDSVEMSEIPRRCPNPCERRALRRSGQIFGGCGQIVRGSGQILHFSGQNCNFVGQKKFIDRLGQQSNHSCWVTPKRILSWRSLVRYCNTKCLHVDVQICFMQGFLSFSFLRGSGKSKSHSVPGQGQRKQVDFCLKTVSCCLHLIFILH